MLRSLPAPMSHQSLRQDSVGTPTEESSGTGGRVDPTSWETAKDLGRIAWNVGVPVAMVAGTFVPLVRQVIEIAFSVRDLCNSAKHNKDICNFVFTRVGKVADVLGPLENSSGKENSYTEASYRALQHLKDTMGDIENFVKNISTTEGLSTMDKARRLLHGPSIKERLLDLLRKFDDEWRILESAVNIASAKLLEERLEQLIMSSDRTMELMRSMGSDIATVKMTVKKHNEQDLQELFDRPTLEISQYERTQETSLDDRRVCKWIRRLDHAPVAFRHIDHSNQEDDKKRFQREINILHMLHGKTLDVAMYYGIVEEGDKRYLVTEWPTYGSLRSYYSQYPLDWTKKLQFAVQIARGLSYLHAVDILHHDVRSDNVIVTEHGCVKLANFGLSRRVADSTKNVARLRERVRYMAPEKLEDQKYKYDFKCEVYSFGLLLWEIAELQRPFGENALSDVDHGDELSNNMRAQWLQRKKKPPEFTRNNRASPDYQRMSFRAQDKNPSHRPVIFTILDQLEHLLREEGTSTTPPPSSESSTTSSGYLRMPTRGYSTDNYQMDGELLPLDHALKQYKRGGERGERALQSLKKYASLDQTEAMFHLAIYILTNSGGASAPSSDSTSSHNDVPPYTDATISDYQVDISTLDTEGLSKIERPAIVCKLLKHAADAGHAEAQCRYGTILFHGNAAVAKSVERARYYLGTSDINGDKNASYYLGMLYEKEDKDEVNALECYKKAALMGVSQAVQELKDRGAKLS